MSLNDISAVVATRDYATALASYSRILGHDPDLEPIDGVAEWQITATAGLQLMEDADIADPDGNEVSFVQDIQPADEA